jgi:hypothetical protein
MSKYHALKTTVDGIVFASKAEASAYCNRKLMQQSGMIGDLELQPAYDLVVNGVKVGRYIADFRYRLNTTGATIVEDVKGVRTPVYRLKKKLVKALYGIDILETSADDIPFTRHTHRAPSR